MNLVRDCVLCCFILLLLVACGGQSAERFEPAPIEDAFPACTMSEPRDNGGATFELEPGLRCSSEVTAADEVHRFMFTLSEPAVVRFELKDRLSGTLLKGALELLDEHGIFIHRYETTQTGLLLPAGTYRYTLSDVTMPDRGSLRYTLSYALEPAAPTARFEAAAGALKETLNLGGAFEYRMNLLAVNAYSSDGHALDHDVLVRLSLPGADVYRFVYESERLEGYPVYLLIDYPEAASGHVLTEAAFLRQPGTPSLTAGLTSERVTGQGIRSGTFTFSFPGMVLSRTVDAQQGLEPAEVLDHAILDGGKQVDTFFTQVPSALSYSLWVEGQDSKAFGGSTGPASPLRTGMTGSLHAEESLLFDLVAANFDTSLRALPDSQINMSRYLLETSQGGTGVIAGKARLQGEATTRQELGIPEGAEFMPLQALVTFHAPAQALTTASLEAHSQALTQLPLQIEHHVTDDTVLVTLEPELAVQSVHGNDQVAEQATLDLIRELRARPDVAHAEPNYIFRMLSVPSDDRYRHQWHYPMIGLENAWRTTTGSSDMVVAVLDTGILHRADRAADTHPDFRCGRVLPGYDFVAADADPYDEGPYNITGYHGTHVAGTIGACTNNTVGGAGVDWSARLLNVRVLGSDGSGSLDTIARAIQWAAGLAVSNTPRNMNPAQVINMSLGAEAPTSSTLQRAIDNANAAGSVIVVAAGNSGVDARRFTPANAAGVITVGAVGREGDMTWYSNYGPALTLMAPGGQHLVNGDANGVLSAAGSAQGGFTYAYYQGTSMAAPHVAGVIALMKAVNPELRWQQARDILAATATPLRTTTCSQLGCGAGLVNAHAAVNAAKSPTTEPAPAVSVTGITDFGADGTQLTLDVKNTGSADATLTLGMDDPRVAVSPMSFTLAPQQSRSVTLSLDRQGLTSGSHQARLTLSYNGRQEQVTLTYQVSATPAARTVDVTLSRVASGVKTVVATVTTAQETDYAFRFAFLSAGSYVLDAAVTNVSCYHAPSQRLELAEGEMVSGITLDLQDNCAP